MKSIVLCNRDHDAFDEPPETRWRCLDFRPRSAADWWCYLYQEVSEGQYRESIAVNEEIADDLDDLEAHLLILCLTEAVRVALVTRKHWDNAHPDNFERRSAKVEIENG